MMADVLTILYALILCGVDHVALFMGKTEAERIADDVFDNSLASCMDITIKELDDKFKRYSDLTCCPQLSVRSGFDLEPERT
jgi:hypothetical protein